MSNKISSEDFFKIQLAQKNVEIAKIKSEAILIENEYAGLLYKYNILQLYYQYKMTEDQYIDPVSGEIKTKEEEVK